MAEMTDMADDYTHCTKDMNNSVHSCAKTDDHVINYFVPEASKCRIWRLHVVCVVYGFFPPIFTQTSNKPQSHFVPSLKWKLKNLFNEV